MRATGRAHRSALDRAFARDGYVIVRGVLTTEECRRLRQRLREAFRAVEAQHPDRLVRFLPPSVAFTVPEAWQWLVKERVVDTLQAILEDHYVLIPDLHVQRNMFGSSRLTIKGIRLPRRWGWHQDAGSEGFLPIHLNPAYRIVKCGLYLQDNDPEFGGGIDLVPGSHRFPLRTGNGHRDWHLRQLAGMLGVACNARTIPLRQGDAVLFHSFVWHSSTLSVTRRAQLTAEEERWNVSLTTRPDHAKLTVYCNVCRSAFSDDFLQHSLGRARAEVAEVMANPDGGELCFCDAVSWEAVKGLPEGLSTSLTQRGVRIGQLRGEALEEAKRLRRQIVASGKLWNAFREAGVPRVEPAVL